MPSYISQEIRGSMDLVKTPHSFNLKATETQQTSNTGTHSNWLLWIIQKLPKTLFFLQSSEENYNFCKTPAFQKKKCGGSYSICVS